MLARSLSHLTDEALKLHLHAAVRDERMSTLEALAFIGEFDARGLHLPAGYPSMFQYCLSELNLSEDSASKRIHAARAARRCPAVLAALADGRLHLSAVVLLARRLTPENADDLIAAASRRSKTQIELMLAERFPSESGPTRVLPVTAASEPVEVLADPHAPGHVDAAGCSGTSEQAGVLALEHAPGHTSPPSTHSKVTPLSPGRYRLETTLEQVGYEDLALAKALLAHTSPACDEAEVVQRALRMLAAHLQKRASAATTSPRPQRGEAKGRHVPAAVRREVWQRDGGCCAFVSDSGVRCGSDRLVQIDHVVPFAKGGTSTSENLRLLCGPHNQYEAKRRFGAGFIEEKQRESRERTAHNRAARVSEQHAPGHVTPQSRAHVDEVVPYLLALKVPKPEARRAAERCAHMPDASLEDRVKVVLQGLGRARFERCSQRVDAAG